MHSFRKFASPFVFKFIFGNSNLKNAILYLSGYQNVYCNVLTGQSCIGWAKSITADANGYLSYNNRILSYFTLTFTHHSVNVQSF